jgi:hypothetical protein
MNSKCLLKILCNLNKRIQELESKTTIVGTTTADCTLTRTVAFDKPFLEDDVPCVLSQRGKVSNITKESFDLDVGLEFDDPITIDESEQTHNVSVALSSNQVSNRFAATCINGPILRILTQNNTSRLRTTNIKYDALLKINNKTIKLGDVCSNIDTPPTFDSQTTYSVSSKKSNDTNNSQIVIFQIDIDNETFETITILDTDPSGNPHIAVKDTKQFVVYKETETNEVIVIIVENKVLIKKSVIGGQTLSDPRILLDDDKIFIVWADLSGKPQFAYLDTGETWTIRNITDDIQSDNENGDQQLVNNDVTICKIKGGYGVSFQDKDDTLNFAFTLDLGEKWQITSITGEGEMYGSPSIVCCDNAVIIAYRSSPQQQLYYIISTNNGESWLPLVNTRISMNGDPDIAFNGTNIVIAYRSGENRPTEIRASLNEEICWIASNAFEK